MLRTVGIALVLAAGAGAAWACTAELPGPPVCRDGSSCAKGEVCSLGRCRPDKRLAASAESPRLLFEPEAMAWLQAGDAPPDGEALVLGRARDGETVLLLRFAVQLPPEPPVQSALLVLEPLAGCKPPPGHLTLELAHVLSPWEPSSVRFSRRPELGVPMHAARVGTAPARPLRLDVTEIVSAWREHRSRYFGLAVLATGDAGGACYATGRAGGRGPHLEVFLRPKQDDDDRDAGADAGADAEAPASEDDDA